MTATAHPEIHTAPGREFPRFRFQGTHLQIGEQFGEACRDLMHLHLNKALARLGDRQSMSRDVAFAKAMRYRPWVLQYAPFFDDEITGISRGAGITLEEAWLLQLRAEVAAPVLGEDAQECTTFAIQPHVTADGQTLVGQNADLPAFYGEIGIVVELVPDDQPAVLMLTPAGQVSYIGMNNEGVGCFANFLSCDGWKLGLPRYFLSRLALTQTSVEDALALVRPIPRASSRNMIMGDAGGTIADLETTADKDARIDPTDGVLAHANHYTAPNLLEDERAEDDYIGNSRIRHARMDELLREHSGRHSPDLMQTLLRDRSTFPDAMCRMPGDRDGSDSITFASVIAQPGTGSMWVAVGPPNENPYVEHRFTT